MVCYAEAVGVNHGVLSLISGCESWYAMLSRFFVNHGVLCWCLEIMLCYAEVVVPNHGVLSLSSGFESWYSMLSSGCES
jgi:hypothetical protein